jgi:hypothetical protein
MEPGGFAQGAAVRFDRALVEEAGGDWSVAQMGNVALDDLSAVMVDQINAADFVDSKVAWMFACLHQAFAYRLVDLGEATIFLWTNKRWLMSVIAARSLLETTALIHYVVREVENAVDAKDAAKLHEIVMQQTFSQKTGDHGLPATHILKAVDRLTKVAPGARAFYDRLSEYTHPNSNGHYFFYSDLDTDQHLTKFSRDKRGTDVLKIIGPVFPMLMVARGRLSKTTEMLGDIAAIQSPQK